MTNKTILVITISAILMAGTIPINNVFAITETKLTASDAAAVDVFGTSVSISGDTAIVGADSDDDNGFNSGSAYIFTRTGGVWSEQAKLIASDGARNDRFGNSVSISGDTVIVGAFLDDDACPSDELCNSGSAYIFTRTGGVWSEQAKLIASDAAAGDGFGRSVSISGDTVIVGALSDDNGFNSGSAYIFTRTGGVWSEQIKLIASDSTIGDVFGWSVSISGDTAIVGVPGDNDLSGSPSTGSAFIFTRSGEGVWSEQAKLTDVLGEAGDKFGESVSISGDTAIVGVPGDDSETVPGDTGVDFGSAHIFTGSGGVWIEQAKLTASDAARQDNFGNSVSISGDTAIVGVPSNDDDGNSSGSAYIFTGSGGVWIEQKLTASDAAETDLFGISVSISGDTAIVGTPLDDDDGNGSGSAYIYELTTNTPPTALDDNAETLSNVSVEIDVLANDSDVDEDSLEIISTSDPSNGVAEISSDNLSITYTPNLGYTGDNSFDYTISDGNDGSATATVMVTVLTPEEGIGNLKDQVDELGLPQGPLTNILQLLNDNNPRNDQAACGMLTEFITNVEGFIANGDVTPQEGQALIDAAEDIKTSLGIC